MEMDEEDDVDISVKVANLKEEMLSQSQRMSELHGLVGKLRAMAEMAEEQLRQKQAEQPKTDEQGSGITQSELAELEAECTRRTAAQQELRRKVRSGKEQATLLRRTLEERAGEERRLRARLREAEAEILMLRASSSRGPRPSSLPGLPSAWDTHGGPHSAAESLFQAAAGSAERLCWRGGNLLGFIRAVFESIGVSMPDWEERAWLALCHATLEEGSQCQDASELALGVEEAMNFARHCLEATLGKILAEDSEAEVEDRSITETAVTTAASCAVESSQKGSSRVPSSRASGKPSQRISWPSPQRGRSGRAPAAAVAPSAVLRLRPPKTLEGLTQLRPQDRELGIGRRRSGSPSRRPNGQWSAKAASPVEEVVLGTPRDRMDPKGMDHIQEPLTAAATAVFAGVQEPAAPAVIQEPVSPQAFTAAAAAARSRTTATNGFAPRARAAVSAQKSASVVVPGSAASLAKQRGEHTFMLSPHDRLVSQPPMVGSPREVQVRTIPTRRKSASVVIPSRATPQASPRQQSRVGTESSEHTFKLKPLDRLLSQPLVLSSTLTPRDEQVTSTVVRGPVRAFSASPHHLSGSPGDMQTKGMIVKSSSMRLLPMTKEVTSTVVRGPVRAFSASPRHLSGSPGDMQTKDMAARSGSVVVMSSASVPVPPPPPSTLKGMVIKTNSMRLLSATKEDSASPTTVPLRLGPDNSPRSSQQPLPSTTTWVSSTSRPSQASAAERPAFQVTSSRPGSVVTTSSTYVRYSTGAGGSPRYASSPSATPTVPSAPTPLQIPMPSAAATT